ncbi:MAG: lytic transglycosylase domain-containing protein [Syntrophobacterales bacterium]|nr:lytic transglycosylase domain-containing protein [Syntrophobacterales bacterium]
MNALRKAAAASIPLTVLLCFTYGHFHQVKISTPHEATKEQIVQKIIQHMENESVSFEDEALWSSAEIIYEESRQKRIDYRLVLAVMKVESNFQHDAVSNRGARGLLQLMPSVAKFIAKDAGIQWHGVKTLDEPTKNIKIGIHHLSSLLDDFESLNLALHAYHVGPTRLKEILSEQHKPDKKFLNLVLKEYKNNKASLPEPNLL